MGSMYFHDKFKLGYYVVLDDGRKVMYSL